MFILILITLLTFLHLFFSIFEVTKYGKELKLFDKTNLDEDYEKRYKIRDIEKHRSRGISGTVLSISTLIALFLIKAI